jgi:hypothetical protein
MISMTDAIKTLLKRIGSASAFALVLVFAPVLAFSETTIKDILDRWLAQCVVVLEMETEKNGAVLLRIHTFGQMPQSLPVTVVAKQGLVERISFLNQIEQETLKDDPSLLVHPMANQRCPGVLCENHVGTEGAERLTVRLQPVRPNYPYQLRVVSSQQEGADGILAYSHPRVGESMNCRVERASLTNYVARQSMFKQIVMLAIFAGLVTLLVGYLRK